MESSYSPCKYIGDDISPLSVLGPFQFNIFICDLLLILDKTYYASHTDDDTSYAVKENVIKVITLQRKCQNIF